VLIVCGCLPRLHGRDLLARYPRVDAAIGCGDHRAIPRILRRLAGSDPSRRHTLTADLHAHPGSAHDHRLPSTGPGYAYLKIADGCDNRCAYCLIPSIRGPYRERPMPDIVAEARTLADAGYHSLILISQDTTFYGRRLYGKPRLGALLERLARVRGVTSLRVMYAHPAHVTRELADAMTELGSVCRYLDLPIQHTDDAVLRAMGRPGRDTVLRSVALLRERIPGIALRTTVMTGFPGETVAHARRLRDDLRTLAFDWLGCFVFSPQPGTAAARLPGRIPRAEAHERRDAIMRQQREITARANRARIGTTVQVLLETPRRGHAGFQAPEVDGAVLFRCDAGTPGTRISARIIEVSRDGYDVVGVTVGGPLTQHLCTPRPGRAPVHRSPPG
jgi:ribosomal protein S12 methylthiotransferase